MIRVSYITLGYEYYVCAGAAPCPRIGPTSVFRLEGQRFTFGYCLWLGLIADNGLAVLRGVVTHYRYEVPIQKLRAGFKGILLHYHPSVLGRPSSAQLRISSGVLSCVVLRAYFHPHPGGSPTKQSEPSSSGDRLLFIVYMSGGLGLHLFL